MVALLSFKKKENEYEPTSNVKNHENHQKSKNPKNQKSKNSKLKKSKNPKFPGRLSGELWIFGLLDFYA